MGGERERVENENLKFKWGETSFTMWNFKNLHNNDVAESFKRQQDGKMKSFVHFGPLLYQHDKLHLLFLLKVLCSKKVFFAFHFLPTSKIYFLIYSKKKEEKSGKKKKKKRFIKRCLHNATGQFFLSCNC